MRYSAVLVVIFGVVCSQLCLAASPYAGFSNGPSTDPCYFPIAVYNQNPSNAAAYQAISVNMYVGLYNGVDSPSLSLLSAAGMTVICNQNLSYKGNKTIVGWLQMDEPDNSQANGSGGWDPPILPSVIVTTYNTMKANDSTRPVMLGLGQGVAWDGWYGRGVRTNHPEDYPQYLVGSDIGCFDIYPVASGDAAVDNKLWLVPYGVDRMRSWSPAGHPVWDDIETTNIGGNGQPTTTQVKAEVWMSLIHGSLGIVYFCHQWYPSFDDAGMLHDTTMKNAVAGINAQIKSLAPALNSPTITGQTAVSSSNINVPIDIMQKTLNGYTYIFAVGMRDGSATATYTLTGLTNATATVLGENRSIPVVNGQFQDAFSAYAVHLYKIAIPAAPGCGSLPYSSGDFNHDCIVDFNDVRTFIENWLLSGGTNSGSNDYPNLVEAKWPDTGNYNIPKAKVVPAIDGTISQDEWTDARPIEMIYPTLTTAPNRGAVRSGTTAPTSNADFSLFWYVKWDPNYLYVAGVVYDDDTNTTVPLDEPQMIFNFQNILTHVWITSMFCINFSNSGALNSNGGPALSNSVMARRNFSGRYVIEAKFKWSDIDLGTGYIPTAGDIHGFCFYCQDNYLNGTRVHVLCDYNCNAGISAPANFNTITLVNNLGCNEAQHGAMDFNGDCIVNMQDFAAFAADWLVCTDVSGAACL